MSSSHFMKWRKRKSTQISQPIRPDMKLFTKPIAFMRVKAAQHRYVTILLKITYSSMQDLILPAHDSFTICRSWKTSTKFFFRHETRNGNLKVLVNLINGHFVPIVDSVSLERPSLAKLHPLLGIMLQRFQSQGNVLGRQFHYLEEFVQDCLRIPDELLIKNELVKHLRIL